MNCSRGGYFALLTLVVLLPMAEGHAQAHGPSVIGIQERAEQRALLERTPEMRAQRAAEMSAWLRRLQGRFSIEGPGKRMEDCIGIGSGPGVQCVRAPPHVPSASGVSAPSMIMYGFDPNEPGIRYLLVNARSIAESDLGKLSGDSVSFRSVTCPKSTDQMATVMVLTCERRLRIYAPPDSRDVLMQYITERLIMVPSSGGRPRGSQRITSYENIRMQRMRD